jgi:hypothetical protein
MTVKTNNPAPNLRTVVTGGFLVGRPTGSVQGLAQQISIRSIQPTNIYKAPIKAGTGVTITNNTINATSGGSAINQLTGDVTAGPGTGSQVATLATVAGSPGTFAAVTFNGKGLTTSGANLSGYGTTSGSTLTVNKVKGATAGGSAAAGDVGEYLSTIVLVASEVNISTAAANVASLSLTAGDWDVFGEAWIDTSAGTVSGKTTVSITTSSATTPTVPGDNVARSTVNYVPLTSTTTSFVIPVGPAKVSSASPTTVFLVGSCVVSGGTVSGYGKICARRR